ncbi:MAG: M48 family metalloprotease, partial [Nitrospinota bacterium]
IFINAAGVAAFYILYAFIVSRAFKFPVSRPDSPFTFQLRSKLALTRKRMTTLSVAMYSAMVYSLDIKKSLSILPSETLEKCSAIFLFYLFLAILWFNSCPLKEHEDLNTGKRLGHVTRMFRFNLAVIIPWFLASLVIDISSLFPEKWILFIENTEWAQVVLFPVFLFFIAVFAPVIILRVWGCQAIDDPDFLQFVKATCDKAQVKIRRTILWPLLEPQIVTAGVIGIINRFRYILLTPSLIRLLSQNEMRSVIAHELGHARYHHLFYNLILFLCFALFTFSYPDFFMLLLLHSGFMVRFPDLFSTTQSGLFNLFFWGGMILSLLLFFRYIFGYYSRNFERQADNFSLTLTGNSVPLTNALTKVALINGMDIHAPNWHHFGIRQRIESLKACEKNPELSLLHDRKITRLKLLCNAIFLLLLILASFSLLKTPGETVKRKLIEGQLSQMIEKEMNNPELYLLQAQLKTEQGEYEESIDAYKKVLSLAPENSTALNNLAWLYVTVEDTHLQNHQESLVLAKKAVSIERKPHTLDTLAEAYFANGDIDNAIQTENEALLLEKKDKSHYKKQLRKYRQEKQGSSKR